MELTQEYFDKSLERFAEKLEAKIDAIDFKLDRQTEDLKDYTHQAFEVQQEYLDERFNDLIVTYDVRDRVERLEREFFQLKNSKTSRV